ncbi:hypothetical protein P3S67_023206 [Capsicum chacoense]|uniref:uncharacterized protein LOC124896233 n=1 Tax=Capsicum annuum TaxID=4072 RepID=UPI001FB1434E|nr:uncharacterized protein LOC124896233 [Capsicum annuum]
MTLSPDYGCNKAKDYVDYVQQQRLLQFLSGLNKVYDQSRRQILMKTAEPTLNQAYAMIIEDENQLSNPYLSVTMKEKLVFKSSGGGDPNPLAIQVGRRQPYKGKKQYAVNYAGILEGDTKRSSEEGKNNHFTEDWYKQILKLLNKGNILADQNLKQKHVNMTDALDCIKELCLNKGDQVCMPTSRKSEITHIGDQDLYSVKVRELGKESEGLYIIKKNNDVGSKKVISNTTTEKMVVDGGLWHMRLGHASVSIMKNQNGIAERKHRYVLDVARALKFQESVLKKFWGEYVLTVVCIINRLPFEVLKGKTPYEMLHDRPPSVAHLRVFGCLYYATELVTKDVVFKEHIFLFDVNSTTIEVSHSAHNRGTDLIAHDLEPLESSTSLDIVMPSLDIVAEITVNAADTADTEEEHDMDQHIEDYDKVDDNNGVRRSIRSTKDPLWHQDYVLTKKRANGTVKYSLSDHLAYDEISQRCKVFFANISALVEPATLLKPQKTKGGLKQ